MRKITKALAATLLVALVLSCFAIFSAFASTEATETSTVKGMNTIYDIDVDGAVVKELATNANGVKVPTLTTEDVSGQDVYTLAFPDCPAGTNPNSKDWIGLGDTTGIIVNDYTVNDVTTPKNTNIVVLDLDMAVGKDNIDKITFQSVWRGQTDAGHTSGAYRSYYPTIFKNEDGSISVGTANETRAPVAVPYGRLVDSDSEWVDITLVMDFSAVAKGTTYCFIDGYFVGQWTSFYAIPAKLSYMRLQTTPTEGTASDGRGFATDNPATRFANLSLKTFSTEYDGILLNGGAQGAYLGAIPELKYCLEDKPETPEDFKPFEIATIERGDETIHVYSADDLHGDLLDGDIVTVRCDINKLRTSYAVKMVAGADGDVPANVVWQDEGGKLLGSEGSLYAAPTIDNIPSAALWATYGGGVLEETGGASVAIKNDAGKWVINDPMYKSVVGLGASTTREVLLFGDYMGYGSAVKNVAAYGDVTPSSVGANSITGRMTYDLNGYKLTKNCLQSDYHYNTGGSANYKLIFKNGTFVNTGAANTICVTTTTNRGITMFANCNVEIPSGTIADIRTGTIAYLNCNVEAASSLANLKTSYPNRTYFVLDGTYVKETGDQLVHLGQTNTNWSYTEEDGSTVSGKNQLGSTDLRVFLKDSEIVASNRVVYAEVYANVGHRSDANTANSCNYYVDIIDSKLSVFNQVVSNLVQVLPKEGEKPLTMNFNVNIEGSEIKALTLVNADAGTDDTTLADYNADFNISDTGLTLYRNDTETDITVGGLSQQKTPGEVVFNLAEGVKFYQYRIRRMGSGYLDPTVNLPEGALVAHTSNYEGYNFIVTSSYAPYTYQLGTQAPVDFYWNVPADGEDAVNIDKVVTLKDNAGVYKYSWAQDGNAFRTVLDKDFTLSAQANLTLWSDLYFNLYVPKALADTYAEYISVVDADGALVEGVYVESLDAYKYQIKSLAPTDAEKEVIFVKTAINGAYGDTYNESKGFTIAEYAENVLSNDKTEDDAVIYALLNYLNAMYVLENGAVDEDIDALLPDDYTEAAISGDAKLGTLADTTIAINCGTTLNWVITGAANASYEVEYYLAGQLVERTVTADANGVAYINVSTMDMLSSITVNGAEINIQGYYGKLVEMGADANVIAAVEAIYDLATAAVAYNA
ncbi:MAG: hypothetical protein IKC87_05170 [Clostridia bacterium]|nr:hypothetical protein [Clostridia bacterium]